MKLVFASVVFSSVLGLGMNVPTSGHEAVGLFITLSRTALVEGMVLGVKCHVPPNENNQKLVFGIADDGNSSERSLSAESAPEFEGWFPVVCDGGRLGFCRVDKRGGRFDVAVKPFSVGGCD